MIRLVCASFAAIGAFVETLFPAPPVRAQASGGGDVPAVPPTVSESTPAGTTNVDALRVRDQEMTRRLAAAGFGADMVEPPLWDFTSDHGRLVSCPGCGGQIRIDGDDAEPYHTATGFIGCESNIFRTK